MRYRTGFALLFTCIVVASTGAAPLPAPDTLGATNVYSDEATLIGTMSLDGRRRGQVSFQYRPAGKKSWRTQKPWQRIDRGETNIAFSSTLTGLAAETTYEFRAVAAFGGRRRNGVPMTFESPPAWRQIMTEPAEALSQSETHLRGFITPSRPGEIQYHFAYGPTPEFGFTNSGVAASTGESISVEATISGLMAGASYHYRLVAEQNGVTGSSDDVTFVQGQVGLPMIAEVEVTPINPNAAMVKACINPNAYLPTAAYIEWGTTTNYGNVTATTVFLGGGVPTEPCEFSIVQYLEDLASGATYHFRIVVSNEAAIAYGDDTVFTTASSAWGGAGLRISPIGR